MKSNIIPRSIGGRLLLCSIIILCLVQIISLLAFYFDSQYKKQEFNNRMMTLRVANVINTFDKLLPETYNDFLKGQHNPGLFIFLSPKPIITPEKNINSEVFASQIKSELTVDDHTISLNSFLTAEQKQAVINNCNDFRSTIKIERHSKVCSRLTRALKNNHFVYSGSVNLHDGSYLNFLTFRAPRNELRLSSFYLLCVFVLTIIGTAALYTIVKVTIRPLNKLTEQTCRLSQNYLSTPLKEEGALEIQTLIQSFNRMQRTLADFISDRTRILACMSHDLKTPLTSMALRAEFLPDSEDKTKLINNIETMTAMVKATLQFAKPSDASSKEEPLNLSIFLQGIVKEYQENGKNVAYTENGDISKANSFTCNPIDMQRIVQNLTDNGLNYGTQTAIKLNVQGGEIQISVTDDGPGIPDEMLSEVFAPFMRLDKARNTTDGHVGLGLSIVRSTILKQGGKITLSNIKPHGLKALITYNR